jgi:hypothetical protein
VYHSQSSKNLYFPYKVYKISEKGSRSIECKVRERKGNLGFLLWVLFPVSTSKVSKTSSISHQDSLVVQLIKQYDKRIRSQKAPKAI